MAEEDPEARLFQEMSRRNTDSVLELVFQKPMIFHRLVELYLKNEEPVSRRAAWVVDLYCETHPDLIIPYVPEIIKMLGKFRHDGLKRHSLRMIARSPLPGPDEAGTLISLCFEWLLSPREAAAAKVHCMEILYRYSLEEPDIRQELADSIEWRMNEESPAFRNKGLKILKKLASTAPRHLR